MRESANRRQPLQANPGCGKPLSILVLHIAESSSQNGRAAHLSGRLNLFF
jgi:hypothetical protein